MEHKIKTFEDAAKALGLNLGTCLPDVSGMPEQHQKATLSAAKLFIVNEALNEGWKPNWNEYSERKYYPWFDLETYKNASSPGFSLNAFDFDYSASTVGSRLCYKSRELAMYAGEQFIDLYRDVFVIE